MASKLTADDMPKLKKIIAHTDRVINSLEEIAEGAEDEKTIRVLKRAVRTLTVAKRDAYALQAIAIMSGGSDRAEQADRFRICQELADRTLADRDV